MRYTVIEDLKTLVTKEQPDPKPDGKRPIIKVEAVGICGSDLHYWEHGPVGLIMGHEFAGTIVDPGDRSDLKVGDRVTCLSTAPCLECDNCKAGNTYICTNKGKAPGIVAPDQIGAYAEYFVPLKSGYVYKLQDKTTFEQAAMCEPVTVTLGSVERAGVKKGDKVLVAGGGLIGAMIVQWCKLKGASWVGVTETNKTRAEMVMKMGYCDAWFDALAEDCTVQVLTAAKAPGGVDVFFECTGLAAPINFGFTVIKVRGTCVWVGVATAPITVRHDLSMWKQAEIIVVLGYTVKNFEDSLKAIQDGSFKVDHYHTDSVTFDGMQKAFETLASPGNDQFKIILYPHK